MLHSQGLQLDRAQRREQLYDIVRECMMRAGVPSSGYKFKVLALDARGMQFLVMMDLAGNALPEERWHEIETSMTQTAHTRFEIGVKAVYWRVNAQLSDRAAAVPFGMPPPAGSLANRRRSVPEELPVSERPTEPAALEGFASSHVAPRHEPVQPDEMAALGEAIAAARRGETPDRKSSARRHAWRATALAGFEDTRILPDAAPGFMLEPTQYGELN